MHQEQKTLTIYALAFCFIATLIGLLVNEDQKRSHELKMAESASLKGAFRDSVNQAAFREYWGLRNQIQDVDGIIHHWDK